MNKNLVAIFKPLVLHENSPKLVIIKFANDVKLTIFYRKKKQTTSVLCSDLNLNWRPQSILPVRYRTQILYKYSALGAIGLGLS